MEEVWNDINLSSLHQYNDNNSHNRQSFPFQDFFSSEVGPTPPSPAQNDTSFQTDHTAIPTKRPSSSTSTALSLNTSLGDPDETYDDRFDRLGFGFPKKTTNNLRVVANSTTDRTLDISLARRDHNNTNTNTNNANTKRAKDNTDHHNIESNDQKIKRLMKSRESADRSRARKQAYIIELEQEVDRLRKENAMLRNQIAKFYLAVPVEVPKKPILRRTLTTPF